MLAVYRTIEVTTWAKLLRAGAFAVSFIYFILVMPHLLSGGIKVNNLSSVLYDCTLLLTVTWIIIIGLSASRHANERNRSTLIYALMVLLELAFFAYLFVRA